MISCLAIFFVKSTVRRDGPKGKNDEFKFKIIRQIITRSVWFFFFSRIDSQSSKMTIILRFWISIIDFTQKSDYHYKFRIPRIAGVRSVDHIGDWRLDM